jgi:hypothetical protein
MSPARNAFGDIMRQYYNLKTLAGGVEKRLTNTTSVIRGLDPRIHPLRMMEYRIKSGNDDLDKPRFGTR